MWGGSSQLELCYAGSVPLGSEEEGAWSLLQVGKAALVSEMECGTEAVAEWAIASFLKPR